MSKKWLEYREFTTYTLYETSTNRLSIRENTTKILASSVVASTDYTVSDTRREEGKPSITYVKAFWNYKRVVKEVYNIETTYYLARAYSLTSGETLNCIVKEIPNE